MLTERRIQVYLPERDYRAIRDRAKEEGKSLAGLVRDAARHYLARDSKERIREGYKILDGIVGLCHDKEGKTDVSERIDYYLYEEGKRRWEE